MASRPIIRGYNGMSEKLGGRCRAQIWRDVKAGLLPRPFSLGPNSVAWWEDEVDAALASRPRRTYGDSKDRPAA